MSPSPSYQGVASAEVPWTPGGLEQVRRSWLRIFLMWLPVCLALAIIVFLMFVSPTRGNLLPPYLLVVCNSIFLGLVSALVAFLAGRHYVMGGSSAVLLLGAGLIAVGLGGFFSAFSFVVDPDESVTVFNCGMLLGGLCNVIGAAGLLAPRKRRARQHTVLLLGYGAVVVAMALIRLGAEFHILPVFFVVGEGPTPVRSVVLGLAIGAFGLAALLLGFAASHIRACFLQWYALGLLLFAIGLTAVFPLASLGTPLAWAGRATLYLGGLYLLMAVITAVRQSGEWVMPLEEALRVSEERYRSLFNAMNEGFAVHEIITDDQGRPVDYRFLDINPAFERLTGLSREKVIGRTLREVLPTEDPTWIERYGKVALTGAPVQFDHFSASIERYFEVFAYRPMERQFAVIFVDITHRKKTEQELRDAKAAAEAASKAKDQFLAILSHELRTPLSPALMIVASQEKNPALPPDVRDDLATVRRNIELETRIIDDLLDISRVISGKMRLQIEIVSLHEVLRAAVQTCAAEIAGRQITVAYALDASRDTVTGDSARLQQVFWNLIKNAVKFSPAGGRIEIRTRDLPGNGGGATGAGTAGASGGAIAGAIRGAIGGGVEVQVRDNGVGIPPDALGRIFEAFQQGGGGNGRSGGGNGGETGGGRQFGGLGLGLAISRAIVQMHGGTIRAESAGVGRGAAFIIELASTPLAAAPGSPLVARAPGECRGGLRVLLVEDHPDSAKTLFRVLQVSGHDVRLAQTLAEARVLAAGEAFDLLISDLGLPDGSGLDLLVEFRRQGIAIPAICTSGYGTDADIAATRAAGFAAHVVKPINLQQLHEAIREVAGGRLGSPES